MTPCVVSYVIHYFQIIYPYIKIYSLAYETVKTDAYSAFRHFPNLNFSVKKGRMYHRTY